MKNKKTLYILFPVVTLIWGVIIYQVIGAFSDPAPEIHAVAYSKDSAVFEQKERELFSLSPIVRDPFLNKRYVEKVIQKTEISTVQKRTVTWPSIQYKGMVSGASGSVFVISINGQDQLLKKGEAIQDVKLLSGSSDSVILRYKNQRKTYTL